ncbi:MAG: methylated-DNA--[protein]-cysteine S-methyltransferase [Deferribacterales bacterium]
MKHWDSVRCSAGYDLFITFDNEKVYEVASSRPENLIQMPLAERFTYMAEYLKDCSRQPMLIEALDDLDFSWTTPFSMAVYRTLALVPFGVTVSYGDLAALSGHSGAFRAVGTAMSKNRFLIIVPCHRVLAAGRKIGGFSSGLGMKRALLKAEGHNEF